MQMQSCNVRTKLGLESFYTFGKKCLCFGRDEFDNVCNGFYKQYWRS